jgi:hypothetical protein
MKYSNNVNYYEINNKLNLWLSLYKKRSSRSFYSKLAVCSSGILTSYGLYKSNHVIIQYGLFGGILSMASFMWFYLTTDKTEEKQKFLELKSIV